MSVQELMNRLETLPVLRQQSQVLGRLGTFEGKLAVAAQGARRTTAYEKAVESVFAAARAQGIHSDLKPVREGLTNAARTARREQKKLKENIEAVGSKETEKKLIAVQSYVESAEAKLRERWQGFIDAFVQDYERLADATEAAKLKGAPQLRLLLTTLAHRAKNPPSSQADADAAIREIDGVRGNLAEMGIETVIGRFLVAVANGSADPRELDKTEIRDFIEGANLWQLLRLKLT